MIFMDKKDKASISIMKIIGVSLIIILLLGVTVRATEANIRTVEITLANGYKMSVITSKTNVYEILEDNNIFVEEDERVSPGLDDDINESNKIVITNKSVQEVQIAKISESGIETTLDEILKGYSPIVEKIEVEHKEIVFQLLKEIIELKSIVLPLLLLCDFYQKDFDEEWATISKEVDRNYLKEQIAYIPFTESEDYLDLNITDVLVYKDKIEKIPAGLMKYFNNLKEVYDDLKEKLSFNQSLLEVERIILLMEKDYQLYPFESFVSELKIHYSKEYFILMKLLEIVMKDCQEAKLGRETVKLTLSLMMNQKLRLKIFGF